jgi:hypothetical protein
MVKCTLLLQVSLLICSRRREKCEEVFGVTLLFLFFVDISIIIGIVVVTV